MKFFYKRIGPWPVVLLVLTALFLSGCGKSVSPEDAQTKYTEALAFEKKGQPAEALKAYQTAANGRFPEQAQALVSVARVALAQKKYDAAITAYTTLANDASLAAKSVNAAPPGEPAEMHVVKEWVGTVQDQAPGGPLWQAEEAKDAASRGNFWYKMMDALVAATGRNPWYSYTLALLLVTVVVKVAITPFTNQQMKTSRKMSAVQPKMKALQEEYKDKPEQLNKAMMTLYKEEGISIHGCLGGMIIQYPILWGLYALIRMYSFQFRKGYFLWVNPDTHMLAPNFLGKNLAQPDMILLVLYAISMFLSQKVMMTPPADDQQRQQQQMMTYMMPIMFVFILKSLPSAFILYWLLFNALTTWQQWRLLKKDPIGMAATVPAIPATQPATDTVKRGPAKTGAKRKKK
jgi:YidC/Oxa1 family membrane protein insertase